MFSFFKKDPLAVELKRAKKVRMAKDRLFWKENSKRFKEDKRIQTFLKNDICPECGSTVELTQIVNGGITNNHYRCINSKCSFEIYYTGYDDDGD